MLRKRAPLLAALVLLLAGLALWGIVSCAPRADAPGAAPAETAYQWLYEESLPAFTRMTVAVKGQEPYSVVSDMVYDECGALLGVRNALVQPILLESQPSFRFGTYAYQMLLLAAQHIPVTRTIPLSEAGDPHAYGLDAPDIRLTIAYADHTRELAIGSLTPSGEGCYVQSDGGNIGLAPYDLYQALIGGLNGMHAQVTTLGYTPEQVTGLSIQRPGQPLIEIRRKAEAERGASVLPYEQVLPFTHDVNAARLQAVLAGLCAAAPDAYAGHAEDEAALAAYGLAVPSMIFTAVVADQYLARLTIGADASEGDVYCTVDRSGDVYRLSREKLAFAENAVPEFLLDQSVALIAVGQVQTVALTRAGQTHTLAPVWGEGASPYAERYLVDGEAIPREDWTARYAELIALTFDKVEARAAQGAPELTLRYVLTDGASVEISFCAYDENYWTVLRDGEARFLIRREKVESVIARWFGATP